MAITFYVAPMSSASPVDAALRELEVPHERVTFNLASGDQKKPEFLKLNPNGKVPTITVDGAPMFEAVAIMQWLGDRYGVARGVWPPADSPARLRALSFTTWSYVQYGSALKCWLVAQSEHVPKQLHNPALAEYSKKELNELLGILDRELTAQPYLLGDQFSLADLIVAGVVGYSVHCGVSTEAFPKVSAWLHKTQNRPSMRAIMS